MEKKKVTISSPVTFTANAGQENPALGWLDFILTDNRPNKNKQGIRQEAFASLIKSGLYMPVKMATGGINEKHDEALPLGAIVSLDENDVSQIVGKASLWKNERPEDYQLLTAMGAAGDPPQISWEILYIESNFDEEGTEWLNDPMLAGATIVKDPAYSGRTPVLSVASTEEDESEDGEEEEAPAEEKPEPEVETPAEEEAEEEEESEPEEEAPAESDAAEAELLKELEELRAYRTAREKEDVASKLLATRLTKLSEAGITVTTEELETNREVWIGMTDEAFAVVAELLKTKETQAAVDQTPVPDVSEDSSKTNIDIVRQGLSEMKNK